ncbi:type II secretion system protein [Neobacillus piezotolerans]|uniref:Type II secretion system protein n=1 Tax=Neobacillus piezotolerans TaxID=2259171 RepID=A0A3D8GL54_9BACI|nr:competence type IV pilus minor pilin ComGD [Neobacillus piezotolerans]RDU35128.1 type II secretion system protein [Neobacillus piezotolerans]
MIASEKGFTMAEALIVLAGFLVISVASLASAVPLYETARKDAFFNTLKADLYYSQLYAISHQREVTVNIVRDKNYYYSHERFDMPFVTERRYSGEIDITKGSMPLSFKFLGDGNVNLFGSFYILIKDEKYKMTIQIGRGRFYVAAE